VGPLSYPPIRRGRGLADHKVGEAAEEYLRRQVAPMLMAEGTPGSDGLRRHGLHGRRDILAATLALNHHTLGAFWSREHEVQYRRRKGESNPQALILPTGNATRLDRVDLACFASSCVPSAAFRQGESDCSRQAGLSRTVPYSDRALHLVQKSHLKYACQPKP